MEFEIEGDANKPPQKSTFVNVLAWIFIVLGGFATFMSILQNIMIHTVFPKFELNQELQHADEAEQIPAFAEFMFNNFDLFFMFFFLVSATSLISAIALLKRKNWARIVFIVLMSVGIVWNISGLVLQFTMFNSISELNGGQVPPPEFQNIMNIMKIASVIMVVAISALFGFVIKKLCSQQIKDEFA
jgi:hypothetical protein